MSCWTANTLVFIYYYYRTSSRYFQQRNGRDRLHFDHGAAQHPAGHEDVPARQKTAPVRRTVFSFLSSC